MNQSPFSMAKVAWGVTFLFKVLIVISGQVTFAEESSATSFKAIRFRVDVTPPVGAQLAYVINEKIDAPIYVSGIVLDDGKTKIVWVSCDFIYICGNTCLTWKEKIAAAARTVPENVFLHSVHQHDSVIVAPEYNPPLLDSAESLPDKSLEVKNVVDPVWCDETLKKVADSIALATQGEWEPITRIQTAERRVGGLAANRRLFDENGKFYTMRFSMCTDRKLQEWPVGNIDPLLRTICFEDRQGRPFVALHFYATHPMAAYMRKMVSPDVPGWAVQYAMDQMPDTLHVYFTGCAGEITFGKYNTTADADAIATLGKRLGDEMLQNMKMLQAKETKGIQLVRAYVDVPFDIERLQGEKKNWGRGAFLLNHLEQWKKAELVRVTLGDNLHFLSMGLSEVCIDYQHYAQSLIPEYFLATAAYSNGIYGYMPPARMFEEGGYESSPAACIVTPEIETRLKTALDELFADLVSEPPTLGWFSKPTGNACVSPASSTK